MRFGQVFVFAFLQRVLSEVMADGDSERRFIDVPERTEENLVKTVSREEGGQNDSQSGADRVENAESHMYPHAPAWPVRICCTSLFRSILRISRLYLILKIST